MKYQLIFPPDLPLVLIVLYLIAYEFLIRQFSKVNNHDFGLPFQVIHLIHIC